MADLKPLEDLVINPRFWLEQGRKSVESRITRIEDAAGKLLTAIAWFWTVYSAAALVGVALADRDLDAGALIVIALPAAALIVAYGLGTWALMPVYTKFIPESPEDVADEFDKAYEEKRKRLGLSMLAGLIAAVLLVVAVGVTAAATPKAIHSFTVDATFVDGTSTVVVGGRFSPSQAVTLKVEPGQNPTPDATSSVLRAQASASGQLDAHLPLVGSAQTWKVSASWTEDDVAKTETIAVAGPVAHAASST